MLKRCLLAVLLAAFALPLLAQNPAHPDLSGTWKLNRAASKLPKGSEVTDVIVIKCSEPNIEMRWPLDVTKLPQSYAADGVSRVIDPDPKHGMEVRAYWKKSTLVIEYIPRPSRDGMKVKAVGPDGRPLNGGQPIIASDIPTSNRWTLSKDGRTLKRESRSSEFADVRVYDKQ